ncbi:DUF1349 domain-containing protein [Micromonospora sp. DR5-3]|uniref:DUF1349 domain-containing protein n=1 Tax=unclassified Micromonospora TaxID=2617518 RepID=UPI0011D8D856|nr:MULTISPECIES: DUF1349 domain-containing protein [unclassified Micromonospora]MCW3819621.1 DUF1349 domain-containing protein [Micromonospora sp. DR5-3]TYC20900.1 DUF1349 domain-containing protein [Micromonospora sp. MP36]
MSTTELLRREWSAFRSPGRLTALAAAALTIIALGLLYAFGNHSSCPGPCPVAPVASGGATVSDRFWFLHRDLGREGSITVRMTSMTGTITYPPPNHDQIVSGLVPWAKAGIIVKDDVRQGSRYAAVMMTGSHGVRFQYDYRHDVAGSAGGVSEQSPRWLRLSRSGDTITGSESADGKQWHTVGAAKLDGLPDTVQVGLFATSPGDLTLRKVGLGGAIEEVRFTQAVGVFDNVTVEGGATDVWDSDPVGEMNHTDWEKYHNASGAAERNGVITISGTGDIGPLGEEGARTVEKTLPGLAVALIIALIVAARYGARTAPETASRQVIAARAAVVGAATFVAGLVAVGVVLPAGTAILKGNGIAVQPMPILTGARVIVGVPAVLALCAVLAYGVGVWLRRGWAAIIIGLSLVALPYAITAFPLLPDTVSEWLLRLTPAAGFAVQQTMEEYPQVTAHYAPSAGYFPLPWWAGLAVLCVYAMIVMRMVVRGQQAAETDWR